jgi:hypothetical protein
MKSRLIFTLLSVLALLCASCATSAARPVLRTPEDSLDAMRGAYSRDDSGLFLHTLAGDTLKRYSEYTIRLGWSELRPHLGKLVEDAKVIEVKDYVTPPRDGQASDTYVWPRDGLRAKRVRLSVRGNEEDFLFVSEVDPPPEKSKQATGIWIGGHYYTRREHRALNAYAQDDVPEKDRTHWRLVFPFYPFQKDGKIAALLQQEIARDRK